MVQSTNTTPKKRPSNRATLEAKLAAMPFGSFQSDRVIPFRVGPLVRDQSWVKHPEQSGEAARQVGIAFRWYWMNAGSRFLPRDYSKLVNTLATHVPPICEAFNQANRKKSRSGVYFQVELVLGNGVDDVRELHLALRRLEKALKRIGAIKNPKAAKSSDNRALVSFAEQSARKSAAKSVGKLVDPAGHDLAVRLIEPFMLISGRKPSGQPNSMFSNFFAAAEELLILRIAQEMKRKRPTLTRAEALARSRKRYRVADRALSVRWAVNEWRRSQET